MSTATLPEIESPKAESPARAETGLSVLSFGSTRGLWEGPSGDDFQRMMGYAAHLDEYVIVANSYKRHGLRRLRLAPHVEAIPTNAFTPFDSLLRMLWIGWSVLRIRPIRLIQAQDPMFLGLVAMLLGRWFKLPVNVCLYGPDAFDAHWRASHWSHRFLAPLGQWVLRHCDGIQVDGKMTARGLIAAGIPAERIAVKPVVPTNLDRFLRLTRPPHPGVPRLLYVGRLAAQKNLHVLIAAAQQLKESGRRFELTIAGEGPQAEDLRAAVERAGLAAIVTFSGQIRRDEIDSVFAAADIFVLTSDFEGYPRVLMEAAAAALPVVTTAVSGSDEAVIDGATGFIVPIGAARAVADQLAMLIDDPAARVRMGAAAREHVRVHLDPRTNTPGQVAIWKKLTTAEDWRAELPPRWRRGIEEDGGRASRRQGGAARHTPGVEGAPPSNAPRRLLLFNLVTDVKHPILGFTTQWINELAKGVDVIHVITMQAGEIAVPANVHVHSVGRERGYSEPRRVLEFYRHLFRVLRHERIDGCFSHMMQIFSVLAGPVLHLVRIPLVTWYAHPSLPISVKLAHFLSDRMVTSLPNAYPYRRDKLAVIGQGIDTALFRPQAGEVASDDLILCVGRLSRVKDHPTLLRAVAQLRQPCRVVILGATSGPDDEAYAREIRELADELGLAEHCGGRSSGDAARAPRGAGPGVAGAPPSTVVFQAGVPAAELPAYYRHCAVHVNLTPAGFGDKVAWEAMSCARPCLVANDDFRETLDRHADELLFRNGDASDLATKLSSLLEKTPSERDAIGADLRGQVERLHSLPRLAERILDQLAQCRT